MRLKGASPTASMQRILKPILRSVEAIYAMPVGRLTGVLATSLGTTAGNLRSTVSDFDFEIDRWALKLSIARYPICY